MQRIIIFDFNRTLFDPEAQKLLPDALLLLRFLKDMGFALFLISRAEQGRENIVTQLGLLPYFRKVRFTKNKTRQDFEALIPRTANRANSFVIGDRLCEEIRIGNQLGLQTIRLQSGKFAHELPQNPQENPTWTVHTLYQVYHLVLRVSS